MLIRFRLRQAPEKKICATISIDGQELSDDGYLSAPDELKSSFEKWQEAYLGLEDVALRLTPKSQKKSFTPSDTDKFAESFKHSFDSWLRGEDIKWQIIREKLVKKLASKHEEDIQILLDVDEKSILRRFPWQDWEFFEEHCPNAEVALYKSIDVYRSIPSSDTVKVLVVVGNIEGIEEGVEEDLRAIKELEQQKRGVFKVLEQPTPHDLLSELGSQSYQIFIFTGHSKSNENQEIGWIELNKTDHLRISDLRQTLRKAIQGGLQLCIFNSCDGLGLAKQLNQLKLPLAIVMREPVPDDVAAKFLRVFLENYSGGQSFFKSFREARHQLEGFNLQYPGVCWLPTVCTGILEEPPTWSNLICKKTDDERHIKIKKNGGKPWILPVGVAAVLIGVSIIVILWQQDSQQKLQPPVVSNPELFSLGKKSLTPESAFSNQQSCLNNIEQKNQGIEQFKIGQFEKAAESFKSFIQQCPFDPEARIYFNNAQAALQSNPIQIAVSVPIGGQLNEAQEMLRGVAQVQDEVNNEDGINGRLLQIMIANDDTSVDDIELLDKAEIVAQNLIRNPNILGVIGHYSSDATQEAGQIYHQNNLVIISPTSTATRKQVKFTDNVFRTPPTDQIAAEKLVNYMNRRNYSQAAIAYESDSEYSESLRQTFTEQIGKNDVVHECDLSVQFFQASECVEKAFDQGAEILALFPSSQLSGFMKTIVEENLKLLNTGRLPLPLLAGDAIYGPQILDVDAQAVNGMVVAVPWHQDSKNLTESSKTFLTEAQKLWGTQSVNWRTASSYDATMALVQGLRQLGDNPSREGLKQVLSSDGFSAPGATGSVEFDEGDRQITSRNQNELGILVEVECYYDDCTYVPLD